MIDLRGIIYSIGWLIIALGGMMLLPAFADFVGNHRDWQAFAFSSVITLFVGVLLVLVNQTDKITIGLRQAFVLTTFTWLILAVFSALPFYLSSAQLAPVDAYFEAMSGLTTTGSTVITNLNETPMGVLLWRSLLQWVGGVGIIVIAVSILPMLQVGGMQLFKTESTDNSDKAMPKVGHIAQNITIIYASLTALCLLSYWVAGMSGFDALNHAMTTVATAGFSTQDSSMGAFDHLPMVKVIAIIFMISGALPFALYVRAMHGDTKSIAKDTQVHVFFGILIIIIAAVYVGNSAAMLQTDTLAALKDTSFALISLLTTTGYTGVDYMTWSPVGLTMVFFAIFVGGCAGSTSGGIKIFRLQIIASLGRMQVFRLLQPHGVYIPYFNRKPIANTVMESVTGFFFFYILFYVALAMILSFMGLDMLTVLSGAASALSNVGPAMGDIIGPTGTYAPLPDAAKWLLSIAMLLGRLEFFTVLVLLTPAFWKH